MAMNGEDITPPHGTPARQLLASVVRRQSAQRAKIDSIDAAVNLLLAAQQETREAVRAEIAEVRGDMRRGFERLGELIDRVNDRHDRDYRRAEDSHHDLAAEVQKTRRLIMFKNVAWPTAVVLGLIVIACTALIIAGKPIPPWMLAIPGALGVTAGALPALLGKGGPS